jgi:hypothetical protein
MAEAADGCDLARKGDRSRALEHLTNAINGLTQRVLPLVERIDQDDGRSAIRTGVVVDLSGIKAGKYVAEMMDDIAKEDFDSVLGTAARIGKDLDQSQSEIAASDFPRTLSYASGK